MYEILINVRLTENSTSETINMNNVLLNVFEILKKWYFLYLVRGKRMKF